MDQNNKESQVTKYGFSFSSYLMHDGNEWYQPGEPGETNPIKVALSKKKIVLARSKFEVVRDEIESQIASAEVPQNLGEFITEALRRLDSYQRSSAELREERDRAAQDAVKSVGEWLQANAGSYDPDSGIFDD